MQDGHHDLQGRALLAGVLADGDPAPVVDDPDASVGEKRDLDGVAAPCHRLVDGVVDDLPHEVVQPSQAGGADVHAGTLADRFQTLQHRDVGGAVVVFRERGWRGGGLVLVLRRRISTLVVGLVCCHGSVASWSRAAASSHGAHACIVTRHRGGAATGDRRGSGVYGSNAQLVSQTSTKAAFGP